MSAGGWPAFADNALVPSKMPRGWGGKQRIINIHERNTTTWKDNGHNGSGSWHHSLLARARSR